MVEVSMKTIGDELLKILVCPQCKGPIEQTHDEKWLVCEKCRLKYEIKDGIPVMLVEEARPLDG